MTASAAPLMGGTTPLFGVVDRLDLRPLMRAQSLVLSTHLNPDGDGIGAELALLRGLERMGKTVRVVNADGRPRRYDFLDPDRRIETADEEAHARLIGEADLLIIVDTNDAHRCGSVYELRGGAPLCVIDHHLGSAPEGAHLICDASCSSTGELVYRILTALGVTVDRDIAEPIYASMLYDTASFRFIRNRAETLRLAAALLDTGVDADSLQEHIFAAKPRDLPILLARVFSKMRYAADGRIVWTTLTLDDVDGLRLDRDDLREAIMILGALDGVDAAFVLKEVEPGDYHLSIRSKRSLDIFDIAARRGGGGHARAAGAPVTGEPHDVAPQIVGELEALLA